ncbi:MAG TPA: hypothetical protein VGM90_11625 [Kofleriaceae bacterium]|jgi:hypothetical protein
MRSYFQLVTAVALAATVGTGCALVTQLTGGSSGSHAQSGGGGGGVAAHEEPQAGCDRWADFNDYKLEPILMLMRCPESEASGAPGVFGEARYWLRTTIDMGLTADAEQLPRMAYVDLCARELQADNRPTAAMAITCAWQADQLDGNALIKELASREDHDALLAQADRDVKFVKQRALAAFPTEKAAREWEVFYHLPTRVKQDVIAQRAANTKDIEKLLAFDKGIQAGTFENCAPPLRDALSAHLRGAKTVADVATKMDEPITYALAEALTRCHYYNEHELEASAVAMLYAKARRRVSLAEQIRYAEIDELAIDAPKAQKFPNLVGTKYSSMKPEDFRPVDPYPRTKLDKEWMTARSRLPSVGTQEGRVGSVEKKAQGATIHFQKERVPLVDLKCHETDRIDSIDNDGKIHWREECTSTSKGMTWSNPPPVNVSDATGVTAGKFVRVGTDGDKGTVLTLTDAPADNARVYRVADVPVGG